MHVRHSTAFTERLGPVLSRSFTWPVHWPPSAGKTKCYRKQIFCANGVAAMKGERGRKRKMPATEQAEAGPPAPKRRAAAVKEVEQANVMVVL